MCDLRHRIAVGALFVLVGAAAGAAEPGPPDPGFVDGSRLVDVVGEEHVRLRVTLGGAILRALAGAGDDPEVGSVVRGLESIHAVILDLGDGERAVRARRAARDLEAELRSKAWEELAYVQEEGATVRVLVRMQGEQVRGLVVLIVDTSEDEPALVFANVTGTIDLARLQEVGRDLDVPGLSELKDLEREKKK